MFIFICINSIDFIISGHDRFCFSFFDCDFKSCRIDFAEGSFIYYGIIRHTAKFLAVCCKMFRTCSDSFALDATDISGCHFSCMIRILGKIFEVSSTQRASLDIQTRSEDYIHAHGHCFLCQCLANFFSQLLIPAVCDSCSCRKTGRRKAGIQPQVIARTCLSSQPMRSIGHKHGRDAVFLKINGFPDIFSGHHLCFFRQCHLFYDIFILQTHAKLHPCLYLRYCEQLCVSAVYLLSDSFG